VITPTDASTPALPARASVAIAALRMTNWLSRSLGRGSGTVAGGRVGLVVDPSLLATLARSRRVALVTGTNGKTTTTRLLAAALSGTGGPAVVSNATGANMPAGHVAALAGAPTDALAVLEVDEGYLDRLIAETSPRVVVLLNLSRDQLDRISEVRMMVERWRASLTRLAVLSDTRPDTVVVANADDPMVVWAALAAPEVRWVGAGQVWHLDAVGCPACGGRIIFDAGGGWACDRCTFARPERAAWLEGTELVLADGSRFTMALGVPGQFNRANAAMAVLAAPVMGGTTDGPADLADSGTGGAVDAAAVAEVLGRVSGVDEVAGRFSTVVRVGHEVRLLLAKNPAGWTALFDLLDEEGSIGRPVVLSINARTADGFDTSWLWDVPFERLVGRSVTATGDRRLDLAVRLRYAGVESVVVPEPLDAVDRAVQAAAIRDTGHDVDRAPGPAVDFVGNYTAFADLRSRA
jgi:UDP-N-acetylmuramyl tripeptide synthase